MNNIIDESFLERMYFIHDVKIFNEMQNQKKILIIDLRSRDEFNKCHLGESINIPYNEHGEDFFKTFDENIISEMTNENELRNKILRFKRFYIAIITSEKKINRRDILKMNGTGDELERTTKSLLLYKSFLNKKIREIGLYNKGFERISNHYYFLVENLYCETIE
jgi:CRISPR/Cas system CSM-associated protein Csm2 small subunit